MTDLDEPRFSLGQIAKALGIPDSTLRAWFRLKYFGLREGDQERQAEGHAHAVSLRTAVWVAIVVELTRYGIPAERAAKVAREFALFAHVDQRTGQTLRYPGELYPGDGVFTALVAYPDDEEGAVFRVESETPLMPIFFNSRTGRKTSALVVWLNFVVRDIRATLLKRE